MMFNKGLKFILSMVIAISLLTPFSINADTQIVPTYSSSAQTWVNDNGFVYVTNYCEGTTASTNSCKLTFTLNSNWYGMIYIDGYDSSNTQWINYKPVFIADGYGEFNYNFWQSSQKVITKITILSINLVKPDSNVDLTQIIQLLTSINNYEQQNNILLDVIDDNTLNTVNEIKNVISQFIISNGYLDIISKIKSFNLPFESLSSVYYLLQHHEVFSFLNLYDTSYPIFELQENDILFERLNYTYETYTWIFAISDNINSINSDSPFDISQFIKFYVNGTEINVIYSNLIQLDRSYTLFNSSGNKVVSKLWKVDFNIPTNNLQFIEARYVKTNLPLYTPIYLKIKDYKYISTDFALQFGLTNQLLDDIHLIASGTEQSSSAAQSNDSTNSQLITSSNQLFTQEDSFKSDMNNAMQMIPQFSVNNFGNKFITSATWVRHQYERMTNNTPFQQVITFSLLVGLSMILIGKVRK